MEILEVVPNGIAAETPKAPDRIFLDELDVEEMAVPIVGLTPLIVKRYDEKTKAAILAAAQGKQKIKTPKDPRAEYEAAMYRFADGGHGAAANGFWQATISAARFYKKGSINMTSLRQFVFPFTGEVGADGSILVRLDAEPRMREDAVHVGGGKGGGNALAYRPEYWPWRTVLRVSFVSSVIDRSSVLSLINAGGKGVGTGEWRPERGGPYGTYRIDPDRNVEVIG